MASTVHHQPARRPPAPRHAAPAAAVVALILLSITPLPAIVAVSSDDPTRARLTVEHATAAQTADIDVAVQRFADAHLSLPDLNIRFSDDPVDCYGYLGTFDSATTPWTIAICSDLAFVPTHEFAHAWLEARVDGDTRTRYLRARHKERWDDKRDDWSERGVEDAAFIIQQNLMITPPTPLTPEWKSRADAYELLTGHTSPLRASPSEQQLGALNRPAIGRQRDSSWTVTTRSPWADGRGGPRPCRR